MIRVLPVALQSPSFTVIAKESRQTSLSTSRTGSRYISWLEFLFYLYFSALKFQGRHNLVLIGDSLGDPKMVGGLKRVDHVIKIGFLNHDVS